MPECLQCHLPPLTAAERGAHGVVQRLRGAGFAAHTVGGAVRDRLLGRAPSEVDVATNATPPQVQTLFAHSHAVGAAFGVIVVLQDDQAIEVATYRSDGAYLDGRHPSSVCFSTAEEDARRRDFTINALFYDPERREVLDHVGGLADLQRGVVRAIGDPRARFSEDYLRLLRAVRFAARFDFALDPATAAAVRALAPCIVEISPERIAQELTKMLVGPHPDVAFRLLHECGLLAHLLPDVARFDGVPQPAEFHPEGDVWRHTLLLLKLLVQPSPALAWGALLHDVGKPPTFARNAQGRETFPCHAELGADLAIAILRRLRCANQLIDEVEALVRYHMTFAEVQRMRPATLRRLLARPSFPAELELHRIDCLASSGRLDNYVFLLDRLHELENQPAVPPPLLTGHDVLALGLRPGPRVGELLRAAQDLQLNGQLADRDAALAWLAEQVRGPGP